MLLQDKEEVMSEKPDYKKICKQVEDFRDLVHRQEEPYFNKLPEDVKTEIRKQHLEMVLNRDFKPMYVNIGPIQNKQSVVQTVLSVMEETKNG